MAEPDTTPTRLDDRTVRELLTRLDTLLQQLEDTPGPAGEVAVTAVSTLAKVYGEALARAVSYASGHPPVLASLTSDELLDHLLVLHDIHPEPVERRVARALDGVHTAVQEHGGRVTLDGIEHPVATVRLSVSGCGSSEDGIRSLVREAVLAAAPELTDVRVVSAGGDTAFVPLDSLGRQPSGMESVR